MTGALPGIKRLSRRAALSPVALALLIRFAAAFIRHDGRRSASQAAGAVRSLARHRAALVRFRADSNWSKDGAVLTQVAALLRGQEARRAGTWAFLLDQTYVGQQGQKAENTFSRGNYRKRPRKGRRRQKKRARRSCPCLGRGLLLTPSGLRLPCCRGYSTRDYCRAKGKPYRTQTQLAAELVRDLAVPAGAAVGVLGDTSFDAQDLRAACRGRGFHWVVPVNPERVLAGPKPRPKVTPLVPGLRADQVAPVRLVPGQGPLAALRRVARCRLGREGKARTYHVPAERRAAHSVGEALLAFSTKEQPEAGKPVAVQEVLMTDGLSLPAARVVELYGLRWQVELFFRELKGTPGLARYRSRGFTKVEGWVQACLVTFAYLEWYRARQLRRRGLAGPERRWWQAQRRHGLCRAPRQEAGDHDLAQLLEWSQTPTGLRKLKKCLRAARPLEYRKPRRNQRECAG